MSEALGVLADDLTGGAAIAAEIARDHGTAVSVVSKAQDISGGSAVVLETASRYIGPDIAGQRVAEGVECLRSHGYGRVMKKIDSTFKGNVGAELAAFAGRARGITVVAPACPAVGLGIRGGVQARGAKTGTDIAALLSTFLSRAPELIPLEAVEAGADAVAQRIRRSGAPVVLADSLTDDHLRTVAEGAIRAGVSDFAGTYGLGSALAPRAAPEGAAASGPSLAAKGILVLAGSANPVTAAQLRGLRGLGATEVAVDVLAALEDPEAECRRVSEAVRRAASPVLVVHSDAALSGRRVNRRRAAEGWTERDLAERIAPPLASAVRAAPGSAVYLIGGETTGAVCDVLGWHRFEVLGEATPAVPLALVADDEHPFVLMKPGGFGAFDAVASAARALLA